MARFLHPVVSCTFRKKAPGSLALCWLLGLGSGGLVFRYAGTDLASRLDLAVRYQPTVPGLLTSALVPLLLGVFAVSASVPRFLYGILFCKAFLLGYVTAGVFSAFGSGGWLVRWLFLFTDLCGAVLLYHFCLRHISGLRKVSPGSFLGYGCILFLAAQFDLRFLLPLLQRCLV